MSHFEYCYLDWSCNVQGSEKALHLVWGGVFVAPRLDAQGKRIAKACFVKVVHNGVLVHENVELTGPTRAATFADEEPTGPLMLQGDHGPVAYRNIRIRPLRPPPASETKKPTAKGEPG